MKNHLFNLFTRLITNHLPVGTVFDACTIVCVIFARVQMVSLDAVHSSTTIPAPSHLEQGVHCSLKLSLSEKVPYTNEVRKYM